MWWGEVWPDPGSGRCHPATLPLPLPRALQARDATCWEQPPSCREGANTSPDIIPRMLPAPWKKLSEHPQAKDTLLSSTQQQKF